MGQSTNPENVEKVEPTPIDLATIDPVNPTPEQAAFIAGNFGTAVQIVAAAAVMKGLAAGNLGVALSTLLNPVDVFSAIIAGHPAQQQLSRLPAELSRGAAEVTFSVSKAPVQAEGSEPAKDAPAA